jgi:acyl-CoA thioesterase
LVLSIKQEKPMATAEERTELMEAIRELANSSPYYRHVQMQVTGFTEQGCIMNMTVEQQHMNLFGNTHGGAVASLADSTCGISLAVVLEPNEYAMTQHLDVNYLKPSTKGILRAEGKLISRGRNTAVLEADIFNESGELVAHAHTIHSIRRRPGGFIPDVTKDITTRK